jgi:hypothetical protein
MHGRIAVVLLLSALFASGCSLAGRTFGRYVDDKALTGAVKLRLAAQHPASVARVNVDTYEGVVYLSGTAQSEEQKSYAEIAARRVEGVLEVVNDVRVRRATPAASPTLIDHVRLPGVPGIARLDAVRPGAPYAAYDAAGRLVATVYTVSMRELAQEGFAGMRATGRSIDHVSIVPMASAADRPDAEYYVVLWHVSTTEAAALR